jgi:hypothetical protein
LNNKAANKTVNLTIGVNVAGIHGEGAQVQQRLLSN